MTAFLSSYLINCVQCKGAVGKFATDLRASDFWLQHNRFTALFQDYPGIQLWKISIQRLIFNTIIEKKSSAELLETTCISYIKNKHDLIRKKILAICKRNIHSLELRTFWWNLFNFNSNGCIDTVHWKCTKFNEHFGPPCTVAYNKTDCRLHVDDSQRQWKHSLELLVNRRGALQACSL